MKTTEPKGYENSLMLFAFKIELNWKHRISLCQGWKCTQRPYCWFESPNNINKWGHAGMDPAQLIIKKKK